MDNINWTYIYVNSIQNDNVWRDSERSHTACMNPSQDNNRVAWQCDDVQIIATCPPRKEWRWNVIFCFVFQSENKWYILAVTFKTRYLTFHIRKKARLLVLYNSRHKISNRWCHRVFDLSVRVFANIIETVNVKFTAKAIRWTQHEEESLAVFQYVDCHPADNVLKISISINYMY